MSELKDKDEDVPNFDLLVGGNVSSKNSGGAPDSSLKQSQAASGEVADITNSNS